MCPTCLPCLVPTAVQAPPLSECPAENGWSVSPSCRISQTAEGFPWSTTTPTLWPLGVCGRGRGREENSHCHTAPHKATFQPLLGYPIITRRGTGGQQGVAGLISCCHPGGPGKGVWALLLAVLIRIGRKQPSWIFCSEP